MLSVFRYWIGQYNIHYKFIKFEFNDSLHTKYDFQIKILRIFY